MKLYNNTLKIDKWIDKEANKHKKFKHSNYIFSFRPIDIGRQHDHGTGPCICNYNCMYTALHNNSSIQIYMHASRREILKNNSSYRLINMPV